MEKNFFPILVLGVSTLFSHSAQNMKDEQYRIKSAYPFTTKGAQEWFTDEIADVLKRRTTTNYQELINRCYNGGNYVFYYKAVRPKDIIVGRRPNGRAIWGTARILQVVSDHEWISRFLEQTLSSRYSNYFRNDYRNFSHGVYVFNASPSSVEWI